MSASGNEVIRLLDCDSRAVVRLLDRYGIVLELAEPGSTIRGSFWGDEEAGLVDNILVGRGDTPLHSLLHEACHYICMDELRRSGLDTDAGGDYDEENAVCYLQILLADEIPDFGRERMLRDMDSWGYSFRLGSAANWFLQDAEDARHWLLSADLIDSADKPSYNLNRELD